jgi:hypothetical protein
MSGVATPGVVERAAEDKPVRRLGALLAPPVIGGGGAVEVRPQPPTFNPQAFVPGPKF